MEKKDKGFFRWLQSFIKPSTEKQESEKKLSKYHYAVVILILGVGFMLVSNIFSNSSSAPDELAVFNQQNNENEPAFSQKDKEMSDILEDIENHYQTRLKEVLQTAVGIDEVEIMINLDATETKIYEKNTTTQTQTTDETDREGGCSIFSKESSPSPVIFKFVILHN